MPDARLLPLVARDLIFAADGQILIDIEAFSLEAGGPTIILGPNGAGKSLLLRLLHGLIAPTAGQILLAGQPMDNHLRTRQAMVFQKPVLLRRSVAANVQYVLPRGANARTDAAKHLQRGGLQDKAGQAARTLSGGEQQRLAIIRALATNPEILFLDEPTSSLDPSATDAIEKMILAASSAGTKIVMVTHNIGQAQRLAEDVVFCNRGSVVEHVAATRFFKEPQSAAAQSFLAGQLVL